MLVLFVDQVLVISVISRTNGLPLHSMYQEFHTWVPKTGFQFPKVQTELLCDQHQCYSNLMLDN